MKSGGRGAVVGQELKPGLCGPGKEHSKQSKNKCLKQRAGMHQERVEDAQGDWSRVRITEKGTGWGRRSLGCP